MKSLSRMTKQELLQHVKALETGAAPGPDSSAGSRAVEIAQQESGERLRAILRTAVEGIITIDERDLIESINPAVEKLFGYNAAEIVGRNVSVLMASPYREGHDRYQANCSRPGQAKIIGIEREVVGRRKDGTVFPMDWSVTEVKLAEGRMFTAFVRDITERKQGEEALRESEERFARAVLATKDGIWDRHIPSKRMHFSARWKTMLGYKEDELPDELATWESRIHSEDKDRVLQAVRDHVAGRLAKYDLEYRLRHKDGSYRWILSRGVLSKDAEGRALRMTGVHTDITERKQAEEALQRAHAELERRVLERTAELAQANRGLKAEIKERQRAEAAMGESERRFRAIFNQMFQFIGLLKPDGTTLEVNHTALDAWGIKASAVIDRPFWETPWWDISPAVRKRLKSAIGEAAQGKFIRYEVALRRRDGVVMTFDFSLKPVTDENKRVVLLISEGRDISERKQAEETLRRARDELETWFNERTAQLAQANEALHADIAERKRLEKEVLRISEKEQHRIGQDLHDGLGQQLATIELLCQSLRSDLVLARPDLESQAAQMCRFLRETIRQTRSLAHGLAPFKLASGGLQVALAELAQNTSSLGHLKCRFYCPSPVLLKDEEAAGHLYRIAQEAVHNAVKHGDPSEVTIRLAQKDGGLRLTVSDDGQGLPNGRKQSLGMGLRVMKHRASVIGADLDVESKPAKGVTVTCTLRKYE